MGICKNKAISHAVKSENHHPMVKVFFRFFIFDSVETAQL